MNKIHIAFDFADKLEVLDDLESVLDEFQTLLSKFGLRTFVMGDLANPHQSTSLGEPVFATRWPDEWSARWQENSYMEFDPVVLETLQRRFPFFWHDIRPLQSGLQARIMDEGGEFSLFDGLCVPIHRHKQPTATVTMAGEKIDLSHDEQKALQLAAIWAHAKVEQLWDRKRHEVIRPLSNREREVLHWIAAGKPVPVIGDILDISDHTVQTHVKNAMRKLDTTTQAQTVAIAIRSGQIAP